MFSVIALSVFWFVMTIFGLVFQVYLDGRLGSRLFGCPCSVRVLSMRHVTDSLLSVCLQDLP